MYLPTKVTLVDDDEDDRLIFETCFDSLCLNCELEQFSSGIDFINQITAPNYILPNVVFLDINLRITTGFEILKTLRSDEQWLNTKIMMYSTSNFDRDIERAKNECASGYIVKALGIQDVTKSIKGALENSSEQKSNSFYLFNK